LNWLQTQVERPVPLRPLPNLGKGQRPKALAPLPGQGTEPDIVVGSNSEIARALSTARAGQTVVILPGKYTFDDKLKTGPAGSQSHPITVKADQPGQVFLNFNAQEGFLISQPYWVFENLQLRGTCSEQSQCEHAFHVIGRAHHTVLRNNMVMDFNAHIKVNGLNGDWPDDGLVQFNTLSNSTPRQTQLPVTPVDIVGANQWTVSDNVISNFVKAQGDGISYGLFMKGGGQGGRIERNLIICTSSAISQAGVRVGLSFGGGGTGRSFCRDPQCQVEHSAGIAANNIVAHCNDAGIDINRSSHILIAHNTLINTAGIDVRNASTNPRLYGNLLEGRIRTHNGEPLQEEMNVLLAISSVFEHADELEFECGKQIDNIPSLSTVSNDFGGYLRKDGTMPGALAQCPGRPAQ